MKPFMIYAHTSHNGETYHTPFTRVYGDTMDDGLENFCVYLEEKFPMDSDFLFCMQQIHRDTAQEQYSPIGGVLSVKINSVRHRHFVSSWGEHDV